MAEREHFIQTTEPLLIASLTKSFQSASLEKIKSVAAISLEKNACDIFGIEQEEESNLSGVTFGLRKSKETYESIQKWNFQSDPFVVVECYDKDRKFKGMDVHTVKDVLADPEKYDTRTFYLLIQKLSDYYGTDTIDKLGLIIDLSTKLKTRLEEEKKEAEKNKDKAPWELKQNEPSNYDLKQRFYFGKSILAVNTSELISQAAA